MYHCLTRTKRDAWHMSKYEVRLTEKERAHLFTLTHQGQRSARMLMRAIVLRLADQGKTDAFIAQTLDMSPATVARTRKKYVLAGMSWALEERPRSGARRKLTAAQERLLLRLAKQTPPGAERWTLKMLTNYFVQVAGIQALSSHTVRRVLWRYGFYSFQQ
jgi:transposase